MEPAPTSARDLVELSKRLARRLLAIGQNRFELLMVEVQEEREDRESPRGSKRS